MQIITKDTTWAAGQVINLTEDVQVAPGVTLTIAPGSVVNGNWHSIEVFGKLKSDGSTGKEVFIYSLDLKFGRMLINPDDHGAIDLAYTHIHQSDILSGASSVQGKYGHISIFNSIIDDISSPIYLTGYGGPDAIDGNIFLDSFGLVTITLSSTQQSEYIRNNIFDSYSASNLRNVQDKVGHGAITANPSVYGSKGPIVISANNAFLVNDDVALSVFGDATISSEGDYFSGINASNINKYIHDNVDDITILNKIIPNSIRATPSSSLPTDMFTFTSIDMPSDIVKTARIVGSADVKLKGNKLDNIIAVNSGNNTIDGGSGVDTIVVHGSSAQYQFSVQNGSAVIKDTIFSRDGTNILTNIEHIQFTDGTIAADLAVTPDNALIYRLYQAAFARMPDEGGLRYWVGKHDKGLSVNDMAPLFRGSQEFTQKYGSNLTNAQYVDQLYLNVLGRKGETGGVTYWNDVLDSGKATKDTVLIGFAGSPENVSGTAAHIDHGFFIG